MGPVMFSFVLWSQGAAITALSQADAAVFSAILVAIPATILAGVAAYNARMNNKQMHPNGGHSMRDDLIAVLDEVREMKVDVREVREDVRSIRDDQRSDHERITRLENP